MDELAILKQENELLRIKVEILVGATSGSTYLGIHEDRQLKIIDEKLAILRSGK